MDLGKRGGDLVVGEGRETVVVVYCIGKGFILNKNGKIKELYCCFYLALFLTFDIYYILPNNEKHPTTAIRRKDYIILKY